MGGTEQSHVVLKIALKAGSTWVLGFDNKHMAEEVRKKSMPRLDDVALTQSAALAVACATRAGRVSTGA